MVPHAKCRASAPARHRACCQRLVHDALDETRREQVREAESKEAKAALKGIRWAPYRRALPMLRL